MRSFGPCGPSPRRLGTLATKVGEICALAALGFAVSATAASPVKLNAESWLLQDFHTGRIFAEHEADRRMEPASLVKLMTTYLAFVRNRGGGHRPRRDGHGEPSGMEDGRLADVHRSREPGIRRRIS